MGDKADFLILLIGTNPLPNFISSLALKGENSKIFLVHTGGIGSDINNTIATTRIAKNLEESLKKVSNNLEIISKECDKSKPDSIDRIIEQINKEIQGYLDLRKEDKEARVNLDYTGGTKIMAAHFYYMFKSYSEKHKNFIFTSSYVDSEIGKVIIEKNEVPQELYIKDIAKSFGLRVEDICRLHGQKLKGFSQRGNIITNEKLNDGSQFERIYLKDFTLICIKESDKVSKEECKLDMFKVKDKAEKLGGDQVRLIYVCKCSDQNKTKLQDELSETFRINLQDRIIILNESDDVEKSIENYIKGM